jgi:hypothetical protein
VLSDAWSFAPGRPAVAFSRIRIEEPLDFGLDLIVDLAGAAFSILVVEFLRSILIEAVIHLCNVGMLTSYRSAICRAE